METVYIWGRAELYGNYQRAVERAGGCVRFGGNPTGCGALLLPGGGDMEPWRYGQVNTASRNLEPDRDAAELALLEFFTTQKKPVLGICRGHQTINAFFGGTLIQDLPGHNAANGIDRLHFVKSAPSLLRTLYGEQSIVNSAHHQAVDRLGSGLQAMQWAPDGTVEALQHRVLSVWGIQWHPERASEYLDGARLFNAFLSLCRT